ncbi:MAG: 2Fe-2S iron-sulfur cluster-binding protein [Pseudomonadota bacterium]
MPEVTYVQPDGTRATHRIAPGDSVLDGALDNGVPGIVGQCGGGRTCATCHCYVAARFLEHVPAPDPDELALLEYLSERRPNSRLACQLHVDAHLDGLVVEIPERQG